MIDTNFIINILLATFLAIITGLERELSGHKGSIKANILITLGACIFVSYEKLMGITDDDRIAANIVTGVGFLCSGYIFKNGMNVKGLGTAATLWCSAGIGVLCAGGYRFEALLITIFLFVANVLLSFISPRIRPLKIFDDNKTDVDYVFNIVCVRTSIEQIKENILKEIGKHEDISVNTIKVNNITEDKVRINIEIEQKDEDIKVLEKIISSMDNISGILSKGWTKTDEN